MFQLFLSLFCGVHFHDPDAKRISEQRNAMVNQKTTQNQTSIPADYQRRQSSQNKPCADPKSHITSWTNAVAK